MFFTRLHRILFLLDPNELAGGGGAALPEGGAPTPPEGTGGHEGGAPTGADVNWQERYTEAQSWGTRNAQRAAELEQEAQLARALRGDDPTARQQALEALGLSIVDDDDDSGQLFDEPNPQLMAKLAELEAWKDQTTSQQQSEANYAAYRQVADPQLQTLGVPSGLHDVIAEAALNLPPVHTPQGQQPDIEGAWNQFVQMSEHFAAIPAVQKLVKQNWAGTKPAGAVTRPGGQGGVVVPQFKDGEERRQYMLERYSADR